SSTRSAGSVLLQAIGKTGRSNTQRNRIMGTRFASREAEACPDAAVSAREPVLARGKTQDVRRRRIIHSQAVSAGRNTGWASQSAARMIRERRNARRRRCPRRPSSCVSRLTQPLLLTYPNPARTGVDDATALAVADGGFELVAAAAHILHFRQVDAHAAGAGRGLQAHVQR